MIGHNVTIIHPIKNVQHFVTEFVRMSMKGSVLKNLLCSSDNFVEMGQWDVK